jgi:hypothetical protein
MRELEKVMAHAEALLNRVSPEGRRQAERERQRRRRAQWRMLKRMIVAVLAILLSAGLFGAIIGPIGQMGFALTLVLMVVAVVVIGALGREPEETPERLATAEIAILPQRAEAWLQRQRPALPRPAQRLADAIGLRLEALGPQLAALDPREPAANGVRKLLAEELPELVNGYARVPESLRQVERDGLAPERQLIEGLTVIDGELARMSADLASGDLTRLATQGRYLELKYKDDGAA